MSDQLINKVAKKAIITFNAEDLLPKEVLAFDLKDFLFKELILKVKDFREQLKELDWTIYTNKFIYITCSTQAIIPMWAYMLAGSYLAKVSTNVVHADSPQEATKSFLMHNIKALDVAEFEGKRIVVKGCGSALITKDVYIALTIKLQQAAKAITFGEACSMVPVFKK